MITTNILREFDKLKPEQLEFCQYWLEFPTTLFAKLTSPTFPKESVRALIVYEAVSRKRLHVINRLLGRYYKMERFDELKRIKEAIQHDTGKRDRNLFSEGGQKSRWPVN